MYHFVLNSIEDEYKILYSLISLYLEEEKFCIVDANNISSILKDKFSNQIQKGNLCICSSAPENSTLIPNNVVWFPDSLELMDIKEGTDSECASILNTINTTETLPKIGIQFNDEHAINKMKEMVTIILNVSHYILDVLPTIKEDINKKVNQKE